MAKGKKKQRELKRAVKASGVPCLPKTTCCVSKDRCRRCPLRMLKEGTLPDGYTVKKRKLVKVDGATKAARKSAKKLDQVA